MRGTHLFPIRPGLWLAEVAAPGFDVRGAVIVGRDMVVVWDTLTRPADMAPVRALLGGRAPVIVYSHADWDHVWGTAALPNAERIVAHTAATDRLQFEGPAKLAEIQAANPGLYEEVRLIPPTLTFDVSHHLDLGGLSLELEASAGHTADGIVGFIPELGVLLAGDAVETPLPLVNDVAAVKGWLEELERWDNSRVRSVIPAHGPLAGRELLRASAAYLRGLLDGVTQPPFADMGPFYHQMHARNVARVAEAGSH
jgi:glyoxylase-like metal-dependent hydrolase (beta-lactamase superfamily II)